MVNFKKASGLVLSLAAAALVMTTPVIAADLKVDLKGDSTSKHYDPAHVGHEHQCASCKRTYNQPGDNGPNSPGSYTCPYCGHQNPIPPSPNPPYPPAPPAPPTPYPPTPYPPAPYPTGSMTTYDLLRMADATSTYSEMDNILQSNVRFVTDLTVENLRRLWDKAHTYEAADAILYNAAASHGYTCYDLCRIWDKARTYDMGDRVLVVGVSLMTDLDVSNIFRLWDKAHSYSYADQILIASMPRLSTYDLNRLKSKSHFTQTDRIIDEEIRRRGGYRNSVVDNSSLTKSAAGRSAKASSSANIAGAIAEIKKLNFPYPVEKTDLEAKELDLSKVEKFVSGLKENKFKPCETLFMVKKSIIERLKGAAVAGDQKSAELLAQLKNIK